MAEAFDCPKCGAPMTFDPDTMGDKETISCPYCNETVVVPENLRTPKISQFTYIQTPPPVVQSPTYYPPVVTVGATTQPVSSSKSSIGGCIFAASIILLLFGIAGAFTFNPIKNALFPPAQNTLNSSAERLKSTATSQDDASPTEPPAPTRTKAPTLTPTTADTPTPEIDYTATAVESTQVAQNTLVTTQGNWPVVLQEKFANDKLKWVVGKSSDNLAIEDATIAANKYTWQVTTKKSMGSFSFPDMAEQTDMFVSLDMQISTDSQNTSDQAGIIFRRSATDKSFYFFGVNPLGTYSLTLYDGTQWNDLISVTQTDALKPKQVNHIAVSAQGNQILLVINNNVVDNFEDAQLSSGTAGLGVNMPAPGETATIIFTNFYVRAPKP